MNTTQHTQHKHPCNFYPCSIRYLLTLCFALFVATYSPVYAGSPEKLIERAYKLAYERNLTEALALFDKLIQHEPEMHDAYVGRAYVLSLQRRPELALQDIYRALSLNNQSPRAYYVRGLIEVRRAAYQRAVVEFNKALEIDDTYKPAIAGKIHAFYMDEDLRRAESLANTAISDFPDYGDFHFHLGKILVQRGRLERAIQSFSNAIDAHEEVYRFDILLSRGDARQNLNLFEEALHDFNRALLIDRNEPSVYHVRGVVYYKLGRFDEAIDDFKKSLDIIAQHKGRYEENNETFYNLGMSYLRTEKRNLACQNFHRACQLENQNACRMIILRCSQQ